MPSENPPATRKPWFKGPLLLLFPWGVVAAMTLGIDFGVDEKLLDAVPNGWMSWDRAVVGLIALLLVCSIFWAYFRNQELGYRGAGLLTITVLTTVVLAVLQIFLLVLVIAFAHW